MNGDDGETVGRAYFSDAEVAEGSECGACPKCGTTLQDLYKDGRMGCAECYVVFRSQVHRALIVLHGDFTHIGKAPASD